MTEMGVAIDGWSANIHTYERCVEGFKQLLGTGEGIVYE